MSVLEQDMTMYEMTNDPVYGRVPLLPFIPSHTLTHSLTHSHRLLYHSRHRQISMQGTLVTLEHAVTIEKRLRFLLFSKAKGRGVI